MGRLVPLPRSPCFLALCCYAVYKDRWVARSPWTGSNKHAHSWTHTCVHTHVSDPQTLSAGVSSTCHPAQPGSLLQGHLGPSGCRRMPGLRTPWLRCSCLCTELESDTKREFAAQALGSGLPPTEQFLQSSLPFKKGLHND